MCGDDDDGDAAAGSKPAIKIATQAFGENQIAGQIYGQILEAQGYEVSYQSFDDRAAIYAATNPAMPTSIPSTRPAALSSSTATPVRRTTRNDVAATVEALQKQFASKNLITLEPSTAVDTNSLVVTEETSESKDVTAISQLDSSFRLGGPQDSPTNAGCLPALKDTYGIDLSAGFQPLDLSGPNTKAALKQGDIDVAVIFSTDSSIEENGWIVLEDDKGIFLADVIVPVVTEELSQDTDLVKSVNDASKALTTEGLTKMNKAFDVDKEDAEAIAADFITQEDLK